MKLDTSFRAVFRGAFTLVGIAAAIGAGAGACFSPRPYPGPDGGGSAGSAGSGGSAGGDAGLPACNEVADCNDSSRCTRDGCVLGQCVHIAYAAVPDDGDPCTVDACNETKETHKNGGQACGSGANLMCSPEGVCAGCNDASQCGIAECQTWECAQNACVGTPKPVGTSCGDGGHCDLNGVCVSCENGVQDGDETDVDCGGGCASMDGIGRCAAGRHCDKDADCVATSTCSGGECSGNG